MALSARPRRHRSTSLPAAKPAGRNTVIQTNGQQSNISTRSRQPALSHHQLLTLHQLNLPRPAIFAPTASSALTRSSAYRRSLSRSQQAIAVEGNALSVPKLTPPTSRSTLRELDLGEILRNPQLRHDVIFDSVRLPSLLTLILMPT